MRPESCCDQAVAGRRLLLMLACCMLPLGLVLAASALGYSPAWYWMLLCPLLHLAMMKACWRQTQTDTQTATGSCENR
ncbi:MAG: hypothetical protein E6X17_06240 [Sporomusaceae bacterium]|nr:hypothetical protein [Sporomusaceae bacterium]